MRLDPRAVMRRSLWRVFAAVVVVAMSVLGTNPQPGRAQEDPTPWTEPVLLSETGRNSWFPYLVTDRSGRIHVVWASALETQTGGYDQVLYAQSDDGIEWTKPNDIAALTMGPNRESEVTRPFLFLDQDNYLHLSYKGLTRTVIYYTKAPVSAAGLARYWAPKQEVGDNAYFSEMAVDRRGTIHIIYTSNVVSRRCPICYHIFYRQSPDGGQTWSDPVDVSQVGTGAAKPQFMIDADDGLHLAWESATGGTLGQVASPAQILYTSSFDYGATWREPVLLQMPESTGSLRVGMAIDPLGRLMITSTALPSHDIYYSLSSDRGQTWSLPATVGSLKGNPISNLDNLSLAADSSGQLHLVCVCAPEIREGFYNLTHVTWNGTEWSEPDIVAQYEGDMPEWPVASVGLGNRLSVVWFVRNEAAIFQSERGQYTIWYAQRTLDAPAIAPVAEPTMPPTATAVLDNKLPTSTPRPTVTPIRIIDGQIDPVKPYDETDYIMLVALSILPVLLIIIGIIVFTRVIRR